MAKSNLFVDPLEPRRLLSADLAVSFVGKIPASIPVTGKSHITVALANRGDAVASGPATVQLYASATRSIDPGAMLLGSVNPVLKLGVGRKSVFTIGFNAPTLLPTGSYYLVAAVIPGFVDDNSADDAAISQLVRISQPFVDLSDSIAMTPANPTYTVGGKAQKPIRFTLTLHNTGNVAANGSVQVDLLGSTDAALDSNGISLQNFGVRQLTLRAEKSVKFIFSWKPTTATQSGIFFGIFQVNSNQGVVETNYANNFAVTASALTIVNSLKPAIT